MTLDKTLLQVVKYKDAYDIYRKLLRDHLLDDTTITILKDYLLYFEKYPTHSVVDFEVFEPWFFQFRHPKMKKEDTTFYKKVFVGLHEDADETLSKTLKTDLQTLHFATLVTNWSQDYIDGKISGTKLIGDVAQSTDDVLSTLASNNDSLWDTSSVEEDVVYTGYDNGLKFRLGCLDASCGSLHPSKFIITGAYVDTGKSTFMADQFGAGMFEQIIAADSHWYTDRPIMWFNNEGSTKAIKMTFYQSLFGVDVNRIRNAPKKVEEHYQGLSKGLDLFRVVPCQGWHIKQVESLIKTYKPCVVIYDMLDNLQGYEDIGTMDQRFRALYDHARQMADQYEHTAIATSQCTGEANGQEVIPMHWLAGSRVAKQSTADLIITIGRSLQAGKSGSRYIHTPKNKLDTQQSLMFNRATDTEVIFDGTKKRFLDPKSENDVDLK